MNIVLWVLIAYIFAGGVCVLHDIRSTFNQNLKKLEDYKYHDLTIFDSVNKKPRRVRTHEQQVEAAFADSFDGIGFTFLLWPLYIILHVMGPVYDGFMWLMVGKEIRKARALDEEKKAKEILAHWEEEEKKKFDGL